MGAPKLHSQRRNSPNVPNNQLSINSSCANLPDCPALPFVRPHARDSVLMHRKQLGFSLRASTTSTDAGDTPGICVLKGVKGRAIQPPRPARAESGRTESRFGSRRIIETSDKLPSVFISGENVRLAIVTSCDDGVLRSPYEGDEREGGYSDGTNSGTRSRIDDADGAVVTFGSTLSIQSVKRNKTDSPENARTSPDGEKATVCTQPPAGLANSPQTVPNGSLSPQNVGAGLRVMRR
jgi:hypothetical protein